MDDSAAAQEPSPPADIDEAGARLVWAADAVALLQSTHTRLLEVAALAGIDQVELSSVAELVKRAAAAPEAEAAGTATLAIDHDEARALVTRAAIQLIADDLATAQAELIAAAVAFSIIRKSEA